MYKVVVEQLREEIIPEIMGNQEGSQSGRGLHPEDQESASIVGN